jgi:hypothetical protein
VSATVAVSVAVGLSVLVGGILKIGQWVGRLEEHLAGQDRRIAALARHLGAPDEGDD